MSGDIFYINAEQRIILQISIPNGGAAMTKNVLLPHIFEAWQKLYAKYDVVPLEEHQRISEAVRAACQHASLLPGRLYTNACNYPRNTMERRACHFNYCPLMKAENNPTMENKEKVDNDHSC